MGSYVLDTHACIWTLAQPRKIGRKALATIRRVESGGGEIWLPAAVLAEIALLRELGRTQLGLPEVESAIRSNGRWRFLPMDLRQIREFSALGQIHDPFDRFLVSAARSLDATLISRDEALTESGLVNIVLD